MKYPGACIALFARMPLAGQVKTRLIPALGVEGACRLHEQLLARILGVLQQQDLCAAELWLDAPGRHPLIDACGLPQQLQQGADLGVRMAHAAATLLGSFRHVLIIGTDTPTLDTAYLQQALQALEQGADVVLGPAFDGGYVLIGLNGAHPALFDEVDWGTERVLQQTLDRVAAAGLRCHLLEPQPDIDRPVDLQIYRSPNIALCATLQAESNTRSAATERPASRKWLYLMNVSMTSPDRSALLKVLVIDDERLSSHNLGIQLKFVGETPLLCSSEQWSEVVAAQGADLLLAVVVGVVRKSDPRQLLSALHHNFPALSILLIARESQPDLSLLPPAGRTCIQILDETALNYEAMSSALRKARELKGVAAPDLKSRIISNTGSALFRSLSGSSSVMQQVRQQVQQVAKRDVTVLVLGESGTGKEVVARNLHYHSGRGEGAFIAVNCATIAPDRYGVELFGQSGGAAGMLERADSGTLYLDEIAELPLNIQTLLLRFLEDKCFHRSGGGELLCTDVRVVAGSAQNLQSRIQQGLFRPDLYYRLTLMPIELPPLRKRLADIPDLVQELLRNLESRGYTPISLNAAAIEALQHHKWPGNVRELANLVERLCIMHSEGVIGVHDLPLEYQHSGDTEALLQEIEALTSKVEERVAVSRAAGSVVPHPVSNSPASMAGVDSAPKTAPVAPAPVPAQPERTPAAAPKPGFDVKMEAPSALAPLNDMLLQHYLYNFEKQLLLTALDDCANILGFAAERLSIGEQELTRKMQTYNLESF